MFEIWAVSCGICPAVEGVDSAKPNDAILTFGVDAGLGASPLGVPAASLPPELADDVVFGVEAVAFVPEELSDDDALFPVEPAGLAVVKFVDEVVVIASGAAPVVVGVPVALIAGAGTVSFGIATVVTLWPLESNACNTS